jgi:hypothetical protein
MNRNKLDAHQTIDSILLGVLVVAMCSQYNLGDIGKDTFATQGYVTKQLKIALPDIALFVNFLWFAYRTTVLRAWKKLWCPPFPCFALIFSLILAALHSRPLITAITENLAEAHGLKALLKALITKESKEAIAETIQFTGYFLLAPMLFVNLIHDRRQESNVSRRRMVLWTFTAAIGLVITWAFVQRLWGAEAPQALFNSANAFSAFLALCLPILLARLLHHCTDARAALGFIGLILIGCLFTLVSLWAVLALAGGGLFLLVLLKADRRMVLFLTPSMLLFIAIWVAKPSPERAAFLAISAVPNIGNGSDPTVSHSTTPDSHPAPLEKVKKQYVEWFVSSLRLADGRESSFATGAGPGNYQFNIGSYFGRLSSPEKVRPDSNNLFLVQACNIGVLGLGVLLWIVLAFARKACEARQKFGGDWLAGGVLASLAVWIFLNMFHALIVRGTGVAFALILSLAVIALEHEWDERARKGPADKRNFFDAAMS